MSLTADVALPRFSTTAQWQELVERFERAELSPAEWDHAGHIAVAAWYLVWFDADEALARVRAGILHLNAVHQAARPARVGYHETITRFYLHMVRRNLAHHSVGQPIIRAVNAVTADLADRSLPLRYYSETRLFSPEARAAWLEPDLLPLD